MHSTLRRRLRAYVAANHWVRQALACILAPVRGLIYFHRGFSFSVVFLRPGNLYYLAAAPLCAVLSEKSAFFSGALVLETRVSRPGERQQWIRETSLGNRINRCRDTIVPRCVTCSISSPRDSPPHYRRRGEENLAVGFY